MQRQGAVHYHPNPTDNKPADHAMNAIKTRCVVYTPPGYDGAATQSLPVLYLLHGVGDVEFSWEVHGHGSRHLDTLIADRSIEPMLVVMPFGFECQSQKLKREFPSKAWFDQFLLQLMHQVEKAYRIEVARTRDDKFVKRAVAGLSMGGKQALEFALDHVELFSAIGSFSAAIQQRGSGYPFPDVAARIEARQAELKNLAVFYHAWGKDDSVGKGSLVQTNRQLVSRLGQLGIAHVSNEMPGGHDWGVWQPCLREFLPLISRAWAA